MINKKEYQAYSNANQHIHENEEHTDRGALCWKCKDIILKGVKTYSIVLLGDELEHKDPFTEGPTSMLLFHQPVFILLQDNNGI